ncbi:hypothetical protein ACIOYV_06350 [Pseudomonas sp. NPDC087342]|uniref:hypothetical protein n=1 Tax=Pseudomonas sp. NPDC087342 TaxID=3364437 RepID=UPI00382D5E28
MDSKESMSSDIEIRNNTALPLRTIDRGALQVLGTLLFMLMAIEPAFAFDAKRHSIYTLQAVQAYRDCAGVNLPFDAGAALAAGTESEDTSLLTIGERATNWHFYNREDKLRPGWFGSRNLDGVFAKRTRALEELMLSQKPSQDDVYELAGRVLHYVQDMSVPAHVIPVFHVKLPLLDRSDPFDNFERRKDLPPFRLTPAECQTLSTEIVSNKSYPATLLENAAQATLKAIGQANSSDTPQNSWARYWFYPARQASDARKGWGDYGDCAFTRGSTTAGCKSDAELDALFEHQYRQALMNSVRILFYVDERLQSSQKTASTR